MHLVAGASPRRRVAPDGPSDRQGFRAAADSVRRHARHHRDPGPAGPRHHRRVPGGAGAAPAVRARHRPRGRPLRGGRSPTTSHDTIDYGAGRRRSPRRWCTPSSTSCWNGSPSASPTTCSPSTRVDGVRVTIRKLRPPLPAGREHVGASPSSGAGPGDARLPRPRLQPRATGRPSCARAVAGLTDVGRRSAVYETDPVGGPEGQGPYLNMVVQLDTDRSPRPAARACPFAGGRRRAGAATCTGDRARSTSTCSGSTASRSTEPDLAGAPSRACASGRSCWRPCPSWRPTSSAPGWEAAFDHLGVYRLGPLDERGAGRR